MAEPTFFDTSLQLLQLQQQNQAAADAAKRQAAIDATAQAERTRDRTLGEVAGDVGLAGLQSAVSLGGSAYGLANVATLGALDRATGFSGNLQETQETLEGWKSAPIQARRENVMGAFQQGVGTGLAEAVTTPSVLADMGVQSLAFFLPGLGAAGAAAKTAQATAAARGASTGAAALHANTQATRAALAANAATMGGMGNVDAINEARGAGLSENEIQLAGMGGAAANALLSFGTNKFTGAAGLEARVAQRFAGAGSVEQAGGVAARIGAGALREGTQEALEESGQQAIRNVAGQRPIEEGTATSAALGGLLGGTFGAAFGAANVRKPTQTREQIQAVQAELEAELEGLGLRTGDRPLDAMMRARRAAGAIQEEIDLGATPLPGETQEEIDIGATPLPGAEFDAEEINLGAVPPPGLSGLNAIVAQQRAIQAQQPPRMGVQEISFDQYTGATDQEVAGLPQVEEIAGRSVQDIIRETAPIERVAQQFGPAVAGAEAARRAAAAEVPVAPAQAPDLSTPKARGAFKASVRQAFVDKAGITPRQAQGAQFEAIVDAAAATGARPGTPEFDIAVGVEAARRLGQVEAAGGQSALLGALVNNYPVTEEQRVGAAFDRGGVATTEEELFGTAPETEAQAPQEAPLIPAEAVKAGEVGQVWVDQQGQEFRVVQAPNAGRTVLVEDAQGGRRGIPFNRVRAQGWQLRPTPQVAGLTADAASQLRNLLAGTYWAERGGRLLRAQGDTGPVVGRTEWLSSIPEVQSVLSNTGYNAADVQGWLDRAATGQGRPLGDKQVAIIEGLLDVMSQPQTEVRGAENITQTPVVSAWLNRRMDDIRQRNEMPEGVDLRGTIEVNIDSPNMARAGRAGKIQAEVSSVQKAIRDIAKWAGDHPTEWAQLSNDEQIRLDFADPVSTLEFMRTGARQESMVDVARREAANQRADAATPRQVTTAAPRYDAQAWADYMTYPGAAQLNALVGMKEQQGNPQPVLAAMLYGIDIAGDLAELNPLVMAAQAHPEFALMPQDGRSEVTTHIAQAVNRVTGATFELADTVPVRPTELQRALAMSEDEYIATINPTGATSEAGDVVIVRVGDLDRPASAPKVATFADSQGTAVDVYADANGTLYAEQGGEVVGQIESRDGETLNIVVQEAQGRGIGTGLAAELIRREPFAQAGSLSPAGEATRRAAFRRVKAQTAKFAQGTAGKAMNKRVFDRAVTTAQGNLTVPVTGVDTVADLQTETGLALPTNVKGMFYNGNIYLVRENIANGKDMALTLAHELGHSGLATLLGPSLNAATNRMWANADMRGRIRGKMADLKMAQGTEAERRASRTLAAEEVLADMLASGERLNKDIWSKLRAGVRDFFARVFGVRDYVVSNKEVDALLGDVARVINGAAAGQVRSEMANADMWLNNPEAAAAADPKFSRIKVDMEDVIAKAQAEPNQQTTPLSDITKAAGEASAGVARQVWNAIKENKLGALYTKHAMHLNQLKDWYDPMFGGRISTLANAKRAKEAFFNQSLTRPTDLEYDGEKLGAASIMDVAGEWTKFSRENPQKHNALNHMKQYSTFYKVFPDKSWEDQRDIDYAAAGYTAEERQAGHARLQKAYQAIGPKGQEIYKKAQAIYKKQWDRHHAVLLAELRRAGKAHQESVQQDDGTIELIQKYESDVRAAMQRISEGPYSPLQRNGEYNVTVWKDNTVAYFAAYDTRQDAEIARKQINENFERTGETGATVNIGGRKDFSLQIDSAGNRGTLEQLTAKIAADLNGVIPAGMEERSRNKMLRALTNSLTESYLQSLPQNAFMQHARTRKNVGGFDMDAMRSFADYTLRSSRTTAGVKYDGVIGSAMTAIDTYVADVGKGLYAEDAAVKNTDTDKLQSIANAVKHQHQASLDVDRGEAARGVMQVSFLYYMTSLSQLFLNASQTYMVALPRLAARYGVAAATREVNKAAGQYFKSGFDLLKEGSVINKAAATDPAEALVAGMLTALYEDGTLDFTQAHDLADVASGAADMLSPYRRAAVQIMSIAMHKSEVFNRQVTSVAAARLELQKRRAAGEPIPAVGSQAHTELQAKLTDAGRNAIDTTHFDYSQSNKPSVMQGDVGALALQFQQFRFHMLAMIGKDIRDGVVGTDPEVKREARRALAYLVGMQLAFTGVAGTILAPIIFGLMDAWKPEDDLTTAEQDFLNYFGKYATHGVLAGAVDTQRIASDSLITLGGKYAPVGGRPSETAQYYVLQNLGPSAGLLFDMLDGAAAVADGEVYDASQKLLPKPFRDAWKAVKETMYGASTTNKIVYHEPSVLSTVTQSIGLRSAERRDVEGVRSAVYRANKTAFDLKNRYLTRMAVAYTSGDRDGIAETERDIQDWNERYPDFAIRAQDMARAVTSRARAQEVATQTGIVSSRMPGQTIDAVLGR